MGPLIIILLHLVLVTLIAKNIIRSKTHKNKLIALLILYCIPIFGVAIYYFIFSAKMQK